MSTAYTTIATDDTRPAPGMAGLAERGLLPDALVRLGIRRLCAKRLDEIHAGGVEAASARDAKLVQALRGSAIALHTDAANRQHYELPPAFFKHTLGPRYKYSCAYYPSGNETLAQAEDAMLGLYLDRAELADGQEILELGCGWGSLTLWMAEHYPNARITAVSNSRPQREHIQAQCQQRGLNNVNVITCDVNALELNPASFDRCVSIEMFEHVRNYQRLLGNIAGWLRPGGKLFVHIFCHRAHAYPFETEGEDNWMGRHFFTGGLMPAADTLLHFQQHVQLEHRWLLDGRHYRNTANHWLAEHDANRDAVMAVLKDTYGDSAALWNQRWRMFWMACAELFGYDNGSQWLVGHYCFAKEH